MKINILSILTALVSKAVLAYAIVMFPGYVLANSGTNVVDKALPSLVAIKTDKNYASGILLTNDGEIVTNFHVIRGAKEITIGTKQKGYCDNKKVGQCYKTEDVYVKAINPLWDLAILKIKNFGGFDIGTQPVGRSSEVSEESIIDIGNDVYALGYPLVGEFKGSTFTDGIISAHTKADTIFPNRIEYEGEKNNHILLRFTNEVEHGSSGGLLLDESGDVVAVVTGAVGRGDFSGFAIPIQYVNRLLSIANSSKHTSFKDFNHNIYMSVSDPYYSKNLYSEIMEDENSKPVSGFIIDNDNDQTIGGAKIYFIEESSSTGQRYKGVVESDSQGRYHTSLPDFENPEWYIKIQSENYNIKELGPLKHLEDFPQEFKLKLREEFKITDATIITDPSMIGLSKGYGYFNYYALIYKGNEIVNNEIIKWDVSSYPPWLVVNPNTGSYLTGKQKSIIELRYKGAINEDKNENPRAQLEVNSTSDEYKLRPNYVDVWADKLPESNNLRISGYLILENGNLPAKPINIGATVDGKEIDIYPTVAIMGRFETYLSKAEYEDKDIKIVIESNSFKPMENDSNLILNKQNKWFTKIKLKRISQ